MLVLVFFLVLAVWGKHLPQPVKCINFYGLETERAGLVCDWKHDPEWYLEKLQKRLGVNTVRLPFSYEYLTHNELTKMEHILSVSADLNLSVILDYHRTWSSHQGATPEEGLTLDDFENVWVYVLSRFQEYTSVVGVGIFNEIQTNNLSYTLEMHRRVINRIEETFPGKYYYFVGCPQWGSNCENVRLEDVAAWNRTFVEVHKYTFSGTGDRVDWGASMPTEVPAAQWFVGELGWRMEYPKEKEWAEQFLAYLRERSISNICLWTVAHSWDTGGWWKDDCETFEEAKAAMLDIVWGNSRTPS